MVFQETRPSFTLPAGLSPATAFFGDREPAIALRGYELTVRRNGAGALDLTLFWEAIEPGKANYIRFVHLIDPATGRIALRADGSTAQADSMPVNNSYPTSQWTRREIVKDSVTLSLEGIRPGSYRLAVGFYKIEEPFPRLQATGEAGQPLADNMLFLPDEVRVGP